MKKNSVYAVLVMAAIVLTSQGTYNAFKHSGVKQEYIEEMVDVAELNSDETQVAALPKEKTTDQLLKQCLTCHTFNEGGKHKTGPNLYNIYMQKIAQDDKFKYSNSFKEQELAWNDDNLDKFLESPRNFIPKTKMTFNGFKKAEERAKVIEYLKTLN